MVMPKKSLTKTSLPWISVRPELDDAVERLVRELKVRKTRKSNTQICEKDAQKLEREFNHAELGRSTADKYMRAFAKQIALEDPEGSFMLADMKDWDRAVDKFNAAGRNLHDLGRGRIYIQSVKDYEAVERILHSKSKNGQVRVIPIQGVKIMPGSIADYLKDPRKSGFAGFLNFDIEIDLGKNRKGTFEIQIMPAAYAEIDPLSHRLYDMIRIIQDAPESYLTPADRDVVDSLVLANQALYIEHAQRSGFIDIRSDKNGLPRITRQKLEQTTEVLDRVRTSLETMEGRQFGWKREAMEATTHAKTSLMNLYLGDIRNHKTKPKKEPALEANT